MADTSQCCTLVAINPKIKAHPGLEPGYACNPGAAFTRVDMGPGRAMDMGTRLYPRPTWIQAYTGHGCSRVNLGTNI